MKFKLGIALLVTIFLAVIFRPGGGKAPAPQPCSSKTPACMKITEADGKVFKLNDFRFLPNHCIKFISLPDNSQRNYCGNYKLDWIGPVPSRAT